MKLIKENELCQCGEPVKKHLQCSRCKIMVGSEHIETTLINGLCGYCAVNDPCEGHEGEEMKLIKELKRLRKVVLEQINWCGETKTGAYCTGCIYEDICNGFDSVEEAVKHD